MDIKTELGPRISWKMHRGNEYRSGSLAMSLLSNSKQKDLLPKTFYVGPNYPNPFNPSTTIDIQTVFDGEFLVNVYDISGRLINTLMNENLASGFYSIKWNGQNYIGESMPTGIYFIQVESGADLSVQKIMLIK